MSIRITTYKCIKPSLVDSKYMNIYESKKLCLTK